MSLRDDTLEWQAARSFATLLFVLCHRCTLLCRRRTLLTIHRVTRLGGNISWCNDMLRTLHRFVHVLLLLLSWRSNIFGILHRFVCMLLLLIGLRS